MWDSCPCYNSIVMYRLSVEIRKLSGLNCLRIIGFRTIDSYFFSTGENIDIFFVSKHYFDSIRP